MKADCEYYSSKAVYRPLNKVDLAFAVIPFKIIT